MDSTTKPHRLHSEGRTREMHEETNRCIVSLATDRLFYPVSLDRLGRSVRSVAFSGSFRPWPPGSFPIGCPSPLEVPFAFKPFCLAEAHAQGAGAALWLDSSCVAVRPLDPIFTAIEANGYVLFRNGSYRLGEWASDHTLSEYGLSRERALALPEVNAAAIGLHFGSRIAAEFLESWHEAARAGTAFRGVPEPLQTWDDYEDVKWNRAGRVSADPRVHGHRHDQTVAGILADRLHMELTLDGLEDHLVLEAGRELRPPTAIVIDRGQILSTPDLPAPPPRPGPPAGSD